MQIFSISFSWELNSHVWFWVEVLMQISQFLFSWELNTHVWFWVGGLMQIFLISFLIRVKHTMSGFELGFWCRFSWFLFSWVFNTLIQFWVGFWCRCFQFFSQLRVKNTSGFELGFDGDNLLNSHESQGTWSGFDSVFDGDFVLDSHESQSTSSGFDLVLMERFFRFSWELKHIPFWVEFFDSNFSVCMRVSLSLGLFWWRFFNSHV